MREFNLVGGNGTGYTGREGDIDYDEKSMGEEEDYNQFFEYSYAKSENLPRLKFDEEHLPLGDSANYCLGLSWTTKKKKKQYDKYLKVRGQEICAQYAKGRSEYEADYPTHGLNFPLWKQHVTRDDSSCSGGIYHSSSGKCFRYEVMSQVCLMVKYSRDSETNTYSWVYTGGCYKDNAPVWYTPFNPGETADFKDVQFEVRTDQRDFSEISAAMAEENDADSNETEDPYDDEDISTQSSEGKNTTEKPAQRIARERNSIYGKAANGEIRTDGFYFFYNLFNLIGSIAIFLAVVCLCYLIFLVVGVTGSNDGESRRLI